MLLGITSIMHAQTKKEFHLLKGDYLGQTPPGDTPIVFARGIVSDSLQQHSAPTFSPDGNEVFWQTNQLGNDKKWINYFKTMRRIKDKWMAPEITPNSNTPFFSPSGKRLYFGSRKEGDDIYFVEKHVNKWSEPQYVNLISRFPEEKFAYYPCIASKGTLYFSGFAVGHRNNNGIYRAELINGEYAKPELLPSSINTPGDSILNWTPYIAPDESYLIYSSRRMIPKDEKGDLYICFRQPDGSWTDPVSLGELINSKLNERFPTVSPDGKYLFFTRFDPDYDEDVYWVSAGIIDKLKVKAIQEKQLKK